MTSHVNVSDTWKEITEKYVNVSGTWKAILEGHVNISGTWKQFFSSQTLALNTDISAGGGAGIFGYDTGIIGSFGSTLDDDWVDGAAQTRTIVALFTDGASTNRTYLYVSGAGVPNTDETFAFIDLDGTIMNRADANYTANEGGNTVWDWPDLPMTSATSFTLNLYYR